MKKKVKYSLESGIVVLIIISLVIVLTLRAAWKMIGLDNGWEADF